ncbi:ATP-binding cassette domain-containing protein [Microbacterium sp. H1-D42]|uniref:ATP-binding cassette domain-containing protein n=1 Tax=Microbacterium sp. H1-D42 TaxID=2925844 RepID=UPI001F53AD96|nr:ATP-binding cassette domain-containing protein [Microbacterium sp. H1-D42]UNK70240.1 ATP-binding cassette domain-containing protein [Microbacterium sp. H1-D42]
MPMPDTSPPVIRTTALRKTYNGHPVLDALDLEVHPGEIFALLGANGAGKTTTINILTTLIAHDAGAAQVAGFDVASAPDEVRRRIALTGQSAAVDDMLTAAENVTMFARLSGMSTRAARRRATALLSDFDLIDVAARRVSTFSGGMRRRLDLAVSLVVAPTVLFLDEPTTGLDTRSRRALWQTIRSLATAGTTIFLTTQYLEEADRLADRIAVLDAGRIVGLGTPQELKSRVGGTSVQLHGADGEVLRSVATDGSVGGIRAALDTIDDTGITGTVSLHSPTLDDVFLTLTGDRPHDSSVAGTSSAPTRIEESA